MLQSDYNNFVVLWTSIKSIYQYSKPVSDLEVQIVFGALNDYSYSDVSKALSYLVANSKEIPVPATIKDTIKMFRHEDVASLKIKANKWLADLAKSFSIGHDIIASDSRAVVAFKSVYRNVREYNNVTKSNEPFLKKSFIESYVETSENIIQRCDYVQGNQIRGIYAHTFNPIVRFIGDIEKCKQISKIVYENKRPRYTTLNDIAEIEYKRAQNEKLALDGTSIPQLDKNASKKLYVEKQEMEKFFQEFFDELRGIKK